MTLCTAWSLGNLSVNRERNQIMDDHQPIEDIHFIEDIGLYFEQMGLPRMAGVSWELY